MKAEILRMLKEQSGYISGQDLCRQFQVSRTAVWKVIKQLEAEGYRIEAVRNRGYQLLDAGDILSKAELESSMNTEWAGKNVLYFNETDSTNTAAKKAAEDGGPHGTLVVTDSQSGGKGRRGRTWASLPGSGLYMSIILRPQLHPSSASMLTLVAAMAVVDGLKQKTGLETAIKWPNDIVCNGKKLCGILTEMSTELECINYVVTGIGINVNNESFPEEIRNTATSLRLEQGYRSARGELAGAVMKSFEKYYGEFIKTCDMSRLKEEYNRHLVNKDKIVQVLRPDSEYSGTSLGINDGGELLVKKESGQIEMVLSGEVSVRGVYGYV